jgi:hypothetical protein
MNQNNPNIRIIMVQRKLSRKQDIHIQTMTVPLTTAFIMTLINILPIKKIRKQVITKSIITFLTVLYTEYDSYFCFVHH